MCSTTELYAPSETLVIGFLKVKERFGATGCLLAEEQSADTNDWYAVYCRQ